ncbi:pyridoxamine 5'-phosphate oxidase family protein [Halovivax gelatinilyticus]|uniref:pyridoxamine 5'-phosphate oxidase family protein n=1 Tax=Halovivax gelatinilyticus TaxID=2961597 RepID=UPI0020CA8DCE|nr:pyridoxamine 5'-phosphate oxidase family protein [Halovivax gelatinilyticus]
MDRIEFRYTVGMDDDALQRYLEREETAVLALADDGDAYAIPVAYHYADGSLYVRLADDGDSAKMRYLDRTETACLTLYDVDETGDSWSVLLTGSLRRLDGDERASFDETAVNESFLELRVFDEDIEEIALALYELEIETAVGRRTPE